jgi:hypothetical protein
MITQAQRDAYRYALEDKGVPEVIAFMAAQNLCRSAWFVVDPAAWLIDHGFYWEDTYEGYDFWDFVYREADRTLA